MFADTPIAKSILAKRYYRGDESTPEQLLRRVARHIALAEVAELATAYEEEFFGIMNDGKFLPNSPCLVNAGYGGGLFACFVLGVDDSLASITQAKADAMAITKAGGGWGIGLSNLRPKGAPVSGSTHGIAGGPIGFWKTFSYDMLTMTQGGFRDAACMATMDVHHKDIEEFITAKSPRNSVRELLNLDRISTDPDATAQELLKSGIVASAAETYLANFNISVLIDDAFMLAVTKNNAEDETKLLQRIAEGAWSNGEPGVLFIDRIRSRTRYQPELITATNPCGEQPLPPNGSCCLGSINLSEFVVDGEFDYGEFARVVSVAVRFLDNMITLNKFPTEATKEWSLANRSIGLGVMGFADALIKMGIRYDSADAREFAYEVASEMYELAALASQELYKEKGAGTIGPFDGRRNNAILSIAPTGTISLLAGCSAGIEPIFASLTKREDRTGEYVMQHKLSELPAFVTLKDIEWKFIVDVVAAFSIHVDSSVSYTVNLPNDATVEDVIDVLKYSWTNGCNGCTIYRDGSRKKQVLTAGADSIAEVSLKRPIVLAGKTYKYVGNIQGKSTNLYVTINENDGIPWEVFVSTPNITSMTELQLVTAVTRLSSLALRVGAPIEKIVEQLRKIEGQSITSVPALIARALSETADIPAGECPECSGILKYQGGCATCLECGYSRCG